MIQTLIFNAAQPVLMGASLFYLTPNSPISSLLPAPTEADVFKARLTSMAIETESFSRSDLYTLFIITRILNFLKGLTLDHQEVSIDAAIQQTQTMDKRSQLGGELLETLLREHRLYAHTTQGRELRQHFKPSLFFKVWNQLSVITTQNRQVIKKANPSFFVKADL